MTPVKRPRPYVSTVRDEAARRTRTAILEAGRDLFVEKGYVATTVDDVARRAGVSKPTVFAAVGSKARLLKEVRDVALAGDDEPVPVIERPWYREALEEPDPVAALRLHARNFAMIGKRYGLVAEVVRAAAAADPELRRVWDVSEQERRFGATRVVDDLRAKTSLRPGLRRADAIDTMWLLMAPDHYVRMVHGAGWSHSRFERWLATTFVQQLLHAGAATAGG